MLASYKSRNYRRKNQHKRKNVYKLLKNDIKSGTESDSTAQKE